MTETNDEEAVLIERRGRVMIITLNRPEAMNAINGALSHGLLNAVKTLDEDDSLTAGVITGSGRGFCSGMDLKAFSRGEDIGPLTTFIRSGSSKPLIAAIEGFAIAGGCEIALTCDLLVASKGAKIGIREVKVGLFAAAGGVFRLPARVGYATAMEMAITGEPILAEKAFDELDCRNRSQDGEKDADRGCTENSRGVNSEGGPDPQPSNDDPSEKKLKEDGGQVKTGPEISQEGSDLIRFQ